MAITYLKSSKTYRKVLLVGFMSCLLSTPVMAQQAVIDQSAIAKMGERLKQAKEDFKNQIEQLKTQTETLKTANEVREGVEEVGDAIGEVASFRIPLPNLDKIRSRFTSDLKCLIPNRPGYGLVFEDWVQASFCDLAVKYRESLFTDVEDWTDLTWFEQQEKRQKIEKNRQSLLADAAVQSLSKADVVINKAQDLHLSINDLESAGDNADTLQKKQAVTNKLLATLNHQVADNNVLLAHMAKTQTAMFIKLGLQFKDLQSQEEKEDTK